MRLISKSNKDMITKYGVGVRSECGKLDIVLMHRPGKELLRLTTENLEELLYDAIPNIKETHRSHDKFAQYLRDQGVHVLYVKELLRETLASSEQARQTLINGIICNSTLKDNDGQKFLKPLRQWLLNRKPEQLGEDVIKGVVHSRAELGSSTAAQSLLDISSLDGKFIVPPLPNLVFTRDAFSIIEKNVFIWHMAKPARRNEPLIMRVIFQYHPQLSTSGLQIVEWQTTNNNLNPATIEGGDVAYLGEGVLLIGSGERTNHAGIEALARTGLLRQVIAVILPPQRDYMHLDTVLSSVGRHAFTLHSRLAKIMEVFTVHMHDADNNNNVHSNVEWTSHGCDVRQVLSILLNDDLTFYDAEDEETSIHEQRDCRHNVVVIDDGHVMTYAGGDPKKGVVARMTRNNECHVGLVQTQGLLEGGGGMHCMTNAFCRRAK